MVCVLAALSESPDLFSSPLWQRTAICNHRSVVADALASMDSRKLCTYLGAGTHSYIENEQKPSYFGLFHYSVSKAHIC